MTLDAIVSWIAGHKFISFACFILLTELAFRRFARGSRAYAKWTAFFKAVGIVWTAVLLSLIYLLSVGPVSLFMRLRQKDLLDRKIGREPTFWQRHEANPLGPRAAVRHQF